jgi:ribosomal protein S27E
MRQDAALAAIRGSRAMIEIVCDNCEKPFQVEDDKAGTKVPCPMCGDINRVPEAAATPRGSATPPGELPPESAPEQTLAVVRPAMFRAHPFRYGLIILMFLGGLVLAIGAAWSKEDGFPNWLAWPGAVITAIGLLWWGYWWLATTLWIKLTISNKRTIRHEGIVRRHSTEVLHNHVRSVDINQNFIQRLLNVGYIGIDSAGQDDIEIEIKDIPGPYDVKKIIDQYRTM